MSPGPEMTLEAIKQELGAKVPCPTATPILVAEMCERAQDTRLAERRPGQHSLTPQGREHVCWGVSKHESHAVGGNPS